MSSFATSVSALAVQVTLLIAVAEHLAEPSSLQRALRSQRVLPGILARPVAAAVITIEGGLAIALGLAMITGGSGGSALLRSALGASTLLFSAYAAYSWYLLVKRDGAPCGCSRHDIMTSVWVVARAAGLASLAALAFWSADLVIEVTASGPRLAIALAAASAFAVLIWHLPHALEDPVQLALAEGRKRVRELGRKEMSA